MRTTILVASSFALAAHATLLWLEAAAMAEVPLLDAAPAVSAALTGTYYGHAWMLGMGALLAAATVTVAARWSAFAPACGWLRLLAIGVFLYSRSMVSHAGASGDFGWAVAADWLHAVLISVWVGEVLVAGLLTLRVPATAEPTDRIERARYVQALSRSATIALGGIIATGLLSAWHSLGDLDHLTGNPYGNTLLIKLALVGAAALLGGANRFLVMPHLLESLHTQVTTTDRFQRRFAAILQIELIFLLSALMMAAALGATAPPMAH